MNQLYKVFCIAGGVVTILLFMVSLPAPTIEGTTLRPVRILSDLLPEKEATADVLPAPRPPKVAVDKPRGKYHPYLPKGVVMIDDYSEGKPGGMTHFYQMLAQVRQLKRPVRIAYYSDSFIEGDVLTADIREKMQQQYGGCGIGWIDCEKGTNGNRPTISLSSNGFNGHVVTQKSFQPERQGINQKYFLPQPGATLSAKATNFRKGTSHWQSAKLFLKSPSPIIITFNGTEREIGGSSEVQMVEAKSNSNNVSLKLNRGAGAVFYGLALESQQGVIVDNLGMRGIPGYSLSHLPDNTLSQFARLRPYDLIIIHYGLNVSADGNPNAFFESYKERMKNVVEKMRRAFPDASILVVGISDRDQRYADGIHTMHSIKRLESYQRLIASESHVAFYSMFSAMGGEDAMKQFVDKKMANKDYTHINFDGGRYIADRFCKSINAGLVNYKRKKAAGLIK